MVIIFLKKTLYVYKCVNMTGATGIKDHLNSTGFIQSLEEKVGIIGCKR